MTSDKSEAEPHPTVGDAESDARSESSPVGTPASAAALSAASLRAMSVVRWLLLLAVAGVAAGTWWTLALGGDEVAVGEPRYLCPMHPQITSHDPGTCPICFMNLEPIPEHVGVGAHAAPGDGSAFDIEAERPGMADMARPAGTTAVMLTTERRQSSGVVVAEAVTRSVTRTLRWPATIEALDGARAEVRVRTDAFVERVLVSELDSPVQRGQTLALVYAPEILRAEEELSASQRSGLASAGSTLEQAAGRRLELLGLSPGEVTSLRAGAAPRLRIPIRSPIRGVVTRFGAALGTRASPADVLYEITDLSRVRVVATVLAPAEIGLAAEGSARLELRGRRDAVPLRFELVESRVEGISRQAQARFVADNGDGTLRPGRVGEVLLDTPEATVILVPRDAVLDRGTARYVFVEVSAGVFEPRTVSVGALWGALREVTLGVEAGERVVSRGGFILDSESRLAAALAPASERGGERATGTR